MTEQKPTVGRVVHYYDSIAAPEKTQGMTGPFAATVAAVHADTCCTLAVLLPWQHEVFVASSCLRKDAAGDNPKVYWEWPPRV